MRRGGLGSRSHPFLGSLLAVLATQAACDKPKLVIEENSLGSWIAINNRFVTQDPDKLWSGVLFQIGNFTVPKFLFGEVTFSKNDSPVGTALKWDEYPEGKAFWVNIVSKKPSDNHDDPLKPTDVLGLLPGSTPAPLCATASGDPMCLRTAKLHPDMERVIGIITYWQGPDGFELEAKAADASVGSTFEFELKDNFRVEIYEINTSASPRTVSPPVTHEDGEIDLITVKKKPVPPEDGNKQDPPWPPPP